MVHQRHDLLPVADAHHRYDARHGHHRVERGLGQVTQVGLLGDGVGEHGQEHDGKEVGDVVARVEKAVGTAVDARLHPAVIEHALQQEGLDAAVNTHQQHKDGERKTLL